MADKTNEQSSKSASGTTPGAGASSSSRSADYSSRERQDLQQPQQHHGTEQASLNMRSLNQALPDLHNSPTMYQGVQQNVFVQPQYPPSMQQYTGTPYHPQQQQQHQHQQQSQAQWNAGLRSPQLGYYQQMPSSSPVYAYQQGLPVQQTVPRPNYNAGPFIAPQQLAGQFYYPPPGGFIPPSAVPPVQTDSRRPSFGLSPGARRHDSVSSGRDQFAYHSGSAASSSSGPIPSTLRGPPRKPKQSGHALWVGNLPPSTNVLDLKDYFSTNLTDAIQSVFWIPKSNCAFVNYRSASSCAAAMAAFHDSTFQGLRLVCRLRQTPQAHSAANSAVQTPRTETDGSSVSGDSTPDSAVAAEQPATKSEASSTPTKPETRFKDRYFIVKSLTVEDLELSVRNGLWATQSHNEDTLNNAFQSSENVYLVFSANKSGEYFGYARMTSAISEVPASELRTDSPESSVADLPKSIQTTATSTAPAGRVIDDSSRGTIFWEVVGDEEAVDDDDSSRKSSVSDKPSNVSAWTKAFKVEWLSTNRVPFFRVRGLRNPWNSNREVKIARDGTEIEPNVGRSLVSVFHQPVMPAGIAHPDMSGMTGAGNASSAGGMPSAHANLYPS